MKKMGNKDTKKTDGWVEILGIPVSSGGMGLVLKTVSHKFSEKSSQKPLIIFTPNPEQIVVARKDDRFCDSLNESSMNIPDGIGLVWAERFLAARKGRKPRLKQRVTGVDVMIELTRLFLKQGKKVFLVGGRDGAAAKAAEKLSMINDQSKKLKVQSSKFKTKTKNLKPEKIIGWNEGVDGSSSKLHANGRASKAQSSNLNQKTQNTNLVGWDQGAEDIANETEEEFSQVLSKIADFGAEVVFVGYGAPWQEYWVLEHKDELVHAGVNVIMVVGGAFDMLAGIVPRAPLKWRKNGLEWLWRLLHQPWRWRRQLRLVEFGWLVFLEWLWPSFAKASDE